MRHLLRRAVAALTHSGPGYGLPQPARGDHVETWLKGQRDALEDGYGRLPAWYALDDLLDDYRLHADTGTPLGQHACAGPHCGCEVAA
jgi:hypothetical protein